MGSEKEGIKHNNQQNKGIQHTHNSGVFQPCSWRYWNCSQAHSTCV